MSEILPKSFSKEDVKNKITNIFSIPCPTPYLVRGYIGLSLDVIKGIHKNDDIQINEIEGVTLVEIRLDRSTLTCEMRNNVCVESYEFKD